MYLNKQIKYFSLFSLSPCISLFLSLSLSLSLSLYIYIYIYISLCKKIYKLKMWIHNLSMTCLQEAWLSDQSDLHMLETEGYQPIS